MTQRFLTVCLAMTALVASTNAFASRARQQVMGTADPFGVLSDGTHGSFYYDDNYNIFYNPAYVNDYKNWVAIERENGAGSAEGGFVYGINNMALGFYFNRGDAVSSIANGQGAAGGNNTITETTVLGTARTVNYTAGRVTASRPVDFFFGYDAGVKLGLGVTYAYARAANPNYGGSPNGDNRLQDIRVRAGAAVADLEPFVDFKVKGSDKVRAAGAANVTDTKNTSFTIGTKYRYGEWTPYAYFRKDKLKSETTGATTQLDASTWGLGLGRSTKLGEVTHLNYALGFHKQSLAGAGTSTIPIDLSLEHDFTSWLVGRTGLSYRLFNQLNGVTQADNTIGRLGMTAKIGKANLDWAVGGGLGATTAAGGATAANGQVDSSTFDFANGLFTTASLTYAW